MKKSLIVLLFISMNALTGCCGFQEVDFETFQYEVNELEEVKVEKVRIIGKVDGETVNFSFDYPQSTGGLIDYMIDVASGKYNKYQSKAIEVAIVEKTPSSYAVLVDNEYTYYSGLGFKVKKADGYIVEWNTKGLLVGIKDNETKLAFIWKRA